MAAWSGLEAAWGAESLLQRKIEWRKPPAHTRLLRFRPESFRLFTGVASPMVRGAVGVVRFSAGQAAEVAAASGAAVWAVERVPGRFVQKVQDALVVSQACADGVTVETVQQLGVAGQFE